MTSSTTLHSLAFSLPQFSPFIYTNIHFIFTSSSPPTSLSFSCLYRFSNLFSVCKYRNTATLLFYPSLFVNKEVEMRGGHGGDARAVNNTLDTINAAATAIASVDNRLNQPLPHVQVKYINNSYLYHFFRLQMWVSSVLCFRPFGSLFPLDSVLLTQISVIQNLILCSMLLCSDCFSSYNLWSISYPKMTIFSKIVSWVEQFNVTWITFSKYIVYEKLKQNCV